MKIFILTLFPEMFDGPFSSSIVKRAQDKGHISIEYVNIREFSTDSYKTVDDHPYGGGSGMILRVDVIDKALQKTKSKSKGKKTKIILLDPQGKPYSQPIARSFSKLDQIILVCGHYEGIDERIRTLVDEEISIGDYVLTGGEIPAMVLVDSITRLIPGVLKHADATTYETFEKNVLEYPQYTRPRVYKNVRVPEILLSGDHKRINQWRTIESLRRTEKIRPDLLTTAKMDSL